MRDAPVHCFVQFLSRFCFLKLMSSKQIWDITVDQICCGLGCQLRSVADYVSRLWLCNSATTHHTTPILLTVYFFPNRITCYLFSTKTNHEARKSQLLDFILLVFLLSGCRGFPVQSPKIFNLKIL